MRRSADCDRGHWRFLRFACAKSKVCVHVLRNFQKMCHVNTRISANGGGYYGRNVNRLAFMQTIVVQRLVYDEIEI